MTKLGDKPKKPSFTPAKDVRAGNMLRATDAELPKTGSGLLHTEVMSLNVGPQHPSTHGVLRLVVDLEGEVVVKVVPHLGYLHTGFEKTMENRTYTQNFTFVPRMDYLHSLAYELAYALPVELLMEAQVPPRAQAIRIALVELNRISSHLVFFGTGLLDLGALSPFFYCFRDREVILDLLEAVTGYRMNYGYFRVGGVSRDIPDGFEAAVLKFLAEFEPHLDEIEGLFAGNPIFVERTKGVGVVSAEDAVDLGLTGPNLRASGVSFDVRKNQPYAGYDSYTFSVPLGQNGDSYDRFMVRMQEIRESIDLVRQAIARIEPGPFKDPNRKISLPPRQELETSMEAVIHHFKLVTEGFHPPRGEVYIPTESARGELGCYVVSDGGSMPYRVKIRAPSFVNLQAIEHCCTNALFADLITVIASLDPVMGDVDR
jgi:NADH-quinone oxidoreductase subunit D